MIIRTAIVRPDEPHTLPSKSHTSDAGFDFYVSRTTIIQPNTRATIPSNIAMSLPTGTWGLVLGRSSTFNKLGLMVHQGTIDSGYHGEIMGIVWNPTNKRVILDEGDRVFQMIVQPLAGMSGYVGGQKLQLVPKLPTSARGGKGFGSSGR